MFAAAVVALTSCAGHATTGAHAGRTGGDARRAAASQLSDRATGAPSTSAATPGAAPDVATLRRLAAIADAAAATWSGPRPWDVRVVLAGQGAASRIGVTFLVGAGSPRYVLALDGRFVCAAGSSCDSGSDGGAPVPGVTTTAAASPAVFSTMLLVVDPVTLRPDPSLGLRYHDVDMDSLGTVSLLDPYL